MITGQPPAQWFGASGTGTGWLLNQQREEGVPGLSLYRAHPLK